MLGKLIKHELNATKRVILPLYAALLVLSIISRLFYGGRILQNAVVQTTPTSFSINFTTGDSVFTDIMITLFMILYIVLIVAVFVSAVIVMSMRFYKNLTGDEGYLMHTLPVKARHLIDAKVVVSCIWIILSIVVAVVSAAIIFLNGQTFLFLRESWALAMAEISRELAISSGLFYFDLIMVLLLSVVTAMIPIYAAIALGTFWNGHRVLGSIVGYMGINTITQTVSSFVLFGYALVKGWNIFGGGPPPAGFFHEFLLVTGLLGLLIGVACYLFTNRIFSKHLNLE